MAGVAVSYINVHTRVALQALAGVTLTNGVRMHADPVQYPGVRVYGYYTAGGYVMEHRWTTGALVLYDVAAQYDAGNIDERDAERIHDERARELPQGPHAAHMRRARQLAIAMHDGAYLAVFALADTFHLATGPRDARSTYEKLRPALDAAMPTYERTRDYLHNDCGVPYLFAVFAALGVTAWDTRSPFYACVARRMY